MRPGRDVVVNDRSVTISPPRRRPENFAFWLSSGGEEGDVGLALADGGEDQRVEDAGAVEVYGLDVDRLEATRGQGPWPPARPGRPPDPRRGRKHNRGREPNAAISAGSDPARCGPVLY